MAAGVGVAIGTGYKKTKQVHAATVTFSSADDAATNNSVSKDGITLSGMGSYQTSDYRFFKGSSVQVTSTVGNITALSFTFYSGSYNGGWNGSTASYSETNLSTTSWSKSCTSGSSGKQARITTLVVTYEAAGSDYVGSLSVSPSTWTGYDSQTLDVSSYTVSGSKNGTAGAVTSSDYEYKGIGYLNNGSFVARDASFSSGHPTTADTRLAWKAKYPTTGGGSTYAWAYVTLSVTADSVQSIAVSGDMPSEFTTADSWDSSGLIVSATYASTTVSTVTSSSSFSYYSDQQMTDEISSPEDLSTGSHTIYVKATYSGVSNTTGYAQTITIKSAPAQTSKTYNYDNHGTDWTMTNEEEKTNDKYWLAPSDSSNGSVATFKDAFTGKTIASDVVITLNVANFGSGTNVSASKFTVYNSTNTSSVTSTGGGTWPSGTSFTNGTLTVSKNDAISNFSTDLVIRIGSGTKQVRLKSVTVSYSYTVSSDPTISVSPATITGYTGQAFSITAEFSNLTSAFAWGSPSVANKISGSVTNTTGNTTDGTSTYSGTLDAAVTGLTLDATGGGATTQTVTFTITKTAFDTLPDSEATVGVGKTTQLSAVLNSGGTITWISDDESVATVDSTGKITGVATGTTTITATSDDDDSVYAECEVDVVQLSEATHTYVSTDGLTVNIQDNGVTIATATMAKLPGSTYNTPTWNSTNSEYRLYGSSSITITPAVNYDLTWISASFTSNASSGNVPSVSYSVDGGASSTFATSTEYEVDSPSSIVITTSASAGNRGFKSISVGYKQSATVVTLESISYTGTLLKPTQYVGQDFDSVGLSFTAHYDNDTTAPLLSSDIEWNDLSLGTSVTGSYQGVNVTVNNLDIIDTTDANEIIFFNNLASDSGNYSDLSTHSKLGDFTISSQYIVNGTDSSIRLSSNSNSGSLTMTSNATGKYISKIIFVAKQYGEDTQALTVSGTSTSETFEPTSDWAKYELDVSADDGLVASFSSPSGKRTYIHSITLILVSEDKTAVTFAQKILDELTCTASGNSAPSTTEWSNLRTYYITGSNVSADGKELLETTSAPYETWKDYEVTQDSTESEIICAALTKYDYVIRKYKTTNYSDFIGRFGEGKVNGQLSSNISPLVNVIGENTNTVAIIVIISMVSVTAIGGYFFLRRRKEQ